jgi:dihydroorotase
MTLLIRNGRVIDPASGLDCRSDILVENGRIAEIGTLAERTADTIINAEGFLVLPGLIDLHVHFREPGREDQETIIGGARVAAKGGFTTVCIMPNTTPPIDSVKTIAYILNQSRKADIRILPIASITRGRSGEFLSEFDTLLSAGAVAFSDDGSPVMDEKIMRKALLSAAENNTVLLAHEEDLSLSKGGSVHDGAAARTLNLVGIKREAEDRMVERDINLCRETGGRLHIQHCSTEGSVELVRRARRDGIKVTCETAPHYFALTDKALIHHGSNAKMNPPLRDESDRRAIIEALRDGTIDVIATDHAPHLQEEKDRGIEKAPFGIVGLETAVSLIISKLVHEEGFSFIDAFSKVTSNPAKILGIKAGALAKGMRADITIIDPERKSLIDEKFFISRCKNSPFIGMNLIGSVISTISNGKIIYGNR